MVVYCRERLVFYVDISVRKLIVVFFCVCVYKRSVCDLGKLWEIVCELNSVIGSNCLFSL